MRRPLPQEIYRHFKGRLYQVLTIARHSETGEELVIYQALYGEYEVYARPLEEFTSEVDRDRYPDAGQKLRFERIGGYTEDGHRFLMGSADVLDRMAAGTDTVVHREPQTEAPAGADSAVAGAERAPSGIERAASSQHGTAGRLDVMSRTIEEEAESLGMDPLVVAFLDADSVAERIRILDKLRMSVTDDMLDIMSMAVDTESPGRDVYERFSALRDSLAMRERFESTRLRDDQRA